MSKALFLVNIINRSPQSVFMDMVNLEKWNKKSAFDKAISIGWLFVLLAFVSFVAYILLPILLIKNEMVGALLILATTFFVISMFLFGASVWLDMLFSKKGIWEKFMWAIILLPTGIIGAAIYAKWGRKETARRKILKNSMKNKGRRK